MGFSENLIICYPERKAGIKILRSRLLPRNGRVRLRDAAKTWRKGKVALIF
jgi:hypothetical protein